MHVLRNHPELADKLLMRDLLQVNHHVNLVPGSTPSSTSSFLSFSLPRCAAPHLCVHQILVFTLTQQQGAIATTTFTRCSSSLSISTAQRWNSCRIRSGSRPSATHPPSIVLSAWPYAIHHETTLFHRYLTSLGSRRWQLSTWSIHTSGWRKVYPWEADKWADGG